MVVLNIEDKKNLDNELTNWQLIYYNYIYSGEFIRNGTIEDFENQKLSIFRAMTVFYYSRNGNYTYLLGEILIFLINIFFLTIIGIIGFIYFLILLIVIIELVIEISIIIILFLILTLCIPLFCLCFFSSEINNNINKIELNNITLSGIILNIWFILKVKFFDENPIFAIFFSILMIMYTIFMVIPIINLLLLVGLISSIIRVYLIYDD